MDHALSCDTVRLVAAPDRRDWERRGKHPMEGMIRAAARTDVPVLITGSKARAKAIAGQIHRRGKVGDRDLAVLDCTLPPYRFEQELFQSDPRTHRDCPPVRGWSLAPWDAAPAPCSDDG